MGLWRQGNRGGRLWLIPLALLVVGAGAAIGLVYRFGGEDQGGSLRSQVTKPVPVHEAARRRVELYFGSAGGHHLQAEGRRIEATDPIAAAEAMVAGLLQGPETPELVSPIPHGTRLLHLFMTEDGTAYVDCSSELSASHPGGVTAERLTLYAIVNTLAMNLKEIERVQILIEGKAQATLAGHLDIRHPKTADPLLVAR
jgi:spore germination protein GerM